MISSTAFAWWASKVANPLLGESSGQAVTALRFQARGRFARIAGS